MSKAQQSDVPGTASSSPASAAPMTRWWLAATYGVCVRFGCVLIHQDEHLFASLQALSSAASHSERGASDGD
ncbi:MAG: hypothetical protein GPOALKHO_001856 [Sodalis sp.]|nr:MAG: hypothetical protein GPOALKHO_001856 [Sodalis sp.]